MENIPIIASRNIIVKDQVISKEFCAGLEYLGRLLMKTRNSIRPNTVPCGTLESTALGSEVTPLMTTVWVCFWIPKNSILIQ